MASKLFSLFPLLLSLFLSLSSQASMADLGPLCSSTQNPEFCFSLLPPNKSGSIDLFYYSRYSISLSLSKAKEFSLMVKEHLSRKSSLSLTAVRALQDCEFLSGLNVDFLLTAAEAVSGSDALDESAAERVQSLLSALLTNQLTCEDGLQSASATWRLGTHLALTDHFSLSLALFCRAWARGAHFPLQMGPIGKDGSTPRREMVELSDIFVKSVVVVSKGQKGNFTTIGAAITAAPDNADAKSGYYLIRVTAGVYEEYVEVPKNKKYVMMVGDGIGRTIVTGNRNVIDGWTTFNSATLAVAGQGFVAVNLTFRNTAGSAKHQAVAVRNSADQSAFYGCSLEGYQDTLYTHILRQFYRKCDIYGTVDFIFGNAAAVFQECNLYARLPMSNQKNMVTAQGRTDANQNTGTSIQSCKIIAAPDLAMNGGNIKTFLGRPWKLYSRTIVMQSFIDKLIDPTGWMPWDGDFALSTLFYAEFSNTGPGAGTGGRVKWPGFHVVKANDALSFTVSKFIDGDTWLPATGVPYAGGLV